MTEGVYYGRLGAGTWEIPFDGVQMLGGYDKDFKERNPWKHVTNFDWDPKSKVWPKDERVKSNSENVVFDGLTMDQQDACKYTDAEKTGRSEKPCDGALRFSKPSIIKNNIIINPGLDGIVSCAGSTVENNIIVNAVDWGIVINSHSAYKTIATVKNNTILFSWSFGAPGKGKYDGSGVEVKSPTIVTNNILAFQDNNGVHTVIATEQRFVLRRRGDRRDLHVSRVRVPTSAGVVEHSRAATTHALGSVPKVALRRG